MLPDPGYPDYRSALALADAQLATLSIRARHEFPDAAALYLNYPSNPTATCAPDGVFEAAIE